MQIGVVSDTHDDADVVAAAVELFTDSADVVIHCGDVVAPFSATPFDTDAFDFYAVRGNNDGEWALSNTVSSFGTYLGEMGALTLDGVDIAVYHGTSEPIVDALVSCGSYDYVLRGHTHQRSHERYLSAEDAVRTLSTEGATHGGDTPAAEEGDTAAHAETVQINPGGLPIPGQEEPPAGVLIDTETGAAEFHTLG
jgi:putative phosphoesterase